MGNLSVLVVEDEESLHPIYGRVIEGLGGTPEFAASGASAAMLLDAKRYACALIDKNLPDMSGLAIAQALRQRDPAIELMIVTGFATVESAVAAMQLGPCDYLVKPFELDELSRRVKLMLTRFRSGRAARAEVDTQKTKLKYFESELERRAAMLLRADQLATLGTLAGGVGHELNNVTAVLSAAVSTIRGSIHVQRPLAPDLLEDLDYVLAHLKNHGRHLLELGRPGPDHADRFDFRDIIRHCTDLLRMVGKTRHVQVDVSLPQTPIHVTVNRTRLEQVLINLIGNAADALEGVVGRQPSIQIGVWQDSPRGRAFCRVSDNGCGIPEERIMQVFEPYFTTKPAGRGTGLGLPVVRQIVEAYGGMLRLYSAPDKGTVVVFDVPEARIPTIQPRV